MLSPTNIRRRQSAVQELFEDNVTRGELIETLREVGDIQRLVGRAVYGTANGRDLQALGRYCAALPTLAKLLDGKKSRELCEIAAADPVAEISALIERAICDALPDTVVATHLEPIEDPRAWEDQPPGGVAIRPDRLRRTARSGAARRAPPSPGAPSARHARSAG